MEEDLVPYTCLQCYKVLNKKHSLLYCEDCLSEKRDIVKSKGPSKIKEEVKEDYCLTCLERSNGDLKVFHSDCMKNGHAVELDYYSHRTVSHREILKDDREINKKVAEKVIINPNKIKRTAQIEPEKVNIKRIQQNKTTGYV